MFIPYVIWGYDMSSYSNYEKDSNEYVGILKVFPERSGRFFVEPLRKRLGDEVYEDCFAIRLAENSGQRNSARMLVNKMYAWRGYGEGHIIPHLPTHTTFTASSGDSTVGTITLAVDSGSGLAADTLFKKEIDQFRARSGAFVCELTKLAFDMRGPSQALLASMFHLVFIYGQRRYRCTDLFIEVNPRHVRFYEHMLGFTPIGDVRMNSSVSAPAQLMWLKVTAIREFINRYAGRAEQGRARTLYSYFFASHEEDAIYGRMLNVMADGRARAPHSATRAAGATGAALGLPATQRKARRPVSDLVD